MLKETTPLEFDTKNGSTTIVKVDATSLFFLIWTQLLRTINSILSNWQLVEEPGFNDRGLYDGKWESFYIDGSTSKKFSYTEGKRDKIWMSFYQDGRRENYTFYNLDSLVTDYDFTYYANLQIMEEPKFSKDGLFDGKWEQFYEGGETKKTFTYDRNQKQDLDVLLSRRKA